MKLYKIENIVFGINQIGHAKRRTWTNKDLQMQP
jgi:hypothetical protein